MLKINICKNIDQKTRIMKEKEFNFLTQEE